MPNAQPACSICSQLDDRHTAFQKGGRESENTYLPAAASHLKTVKDLDPSGRTFQLQQCPQCGTYYLYEHTYEFLVYGSEDDESLTRLPAGKAAEYLAK